MFLQGLRTAACAMAGSAEEGSMLNLLALSVGEPRRGVATTTLRRLECTSVQSAARVLGRCSC